ncbi:MAG: hypothetical protein ACJA0O_000082 [Porticoccus sp.]|jgi:hypothetical protein
MSKLKHETELLKEALRIGMIYAEKRGAAKFEASDSANEKIEYIYKLLVHDKLIQPLANEQHDIVHLPDTGCYNDSCLAWFNCPPTGISEYDPSGKVNS